MLHQKAHFLSGSGFSPLELLLAGGGFGSLENEVDVETRNAWQVCLNVSLESFESVHIRGLRHIINFRLSSTKNTPIFFTSSIPATGNWAANHGDDIPVPEAVLDRAKEQCMERANTSLRRYGYCF
jgi:hypothetical protein